MPDQVAAVDKPKLHLWETGVMRITRHPQSFGQALWCFAHTLWIGKLPSFSMSPLQRLPVQPSPHPRVLHLEKLLQPSHCTICNMIVS